MTFYLGLGPELYPRSTRRQQRTAPFSNFRGGRPYLDVLVVDKIRKMRILCTSKCTM